MIVRRWLAPKEPDIESIKKLFEAEGYEPFVEKFDAGTVLPDHRHPFDEVRMVVEGELLVNVAGNQLLLRPGDKIVIPSNTRHSKKVNGAKACVCVCANVVR
ncbi:MAG: cupin domain-containing protein [Bdellovibrio sp.]|nr:MAG: cupin domain-containing protein [Bdellovibrio sp.]